MLGMGRHSIQIVPSVRGTEKIDLQALEICLQDCASKNRSVIVVANAGTINTVDYDNFVGIGMVITSWRDFSHVES